MTWAINGMKEWGLIGAIAVILCLTMAQGWFMFVEGKYSNPPLVYTMQQGATHKTITNTYHPGELVEARVIALKNKDTTGWIQWCLWQGDKMVKAYPARMGWLKKGFNDRIVPVEKLPDDLPPGDYRFRGVVEYNLRMKSVYVEAKTNCFGVK